jgi:alginate O-acetyltransferase complex protein AlgI
MLFNSQEYLYVFLPLVVVVYACLSSLNKQKLLIPMLLVSSLFFYGFWNPKFLILLVLSALLNFYTAKLLGNFKKKVLLVLCISLNLFVLGYFKYSGFFIDNLNAITGSEYHIKSLILPLGISFFTFSQIAYVIEAYRGKSVADSFTKFLLFVTFFPYVSSGPITYYREVDRQLENKSGLKFSWNNLTVGFILFSFGLFKKTVLADNLALYASPLFDNVITDEGNITNVISYDLINTWKAALAYTFQLYFDFSGYSDMAIGTAQIFGIKLPINFNSPYKARNIVEFWKRWHMTLSRFFRDYVFLPLSFTLSRKIPQSSIFGSDLIIYGTGILVTWMLTGLWHGAGWTFVFWGCLHAVYLIINRILKKPKKKFFKTIGISEKRAVVAICYQFLTFLAVTVAWVYFRSNEFSSANRIITGMAGFNGIMTSNTEFDGLLIILFAAVIVFFMPNTQEILYDFKIGLDTYGQPAFRPREKFVLKFNLKFSIIIAVILAICIIFVQSVQKMEFIYNDF